MGKCLELTQALGICVQYKQRCVQNCMFNVVGFLQAGSHLTCVQRAPWAKRIALPLPPSMALSPRGSEKPEMAC